MNLTQILKETSQRRVSNAKKQMSAQTLEKKETSGCISEAFAIDLLLEEAMSKHGGNLLEKNILHLVREYNSNDISGNLRSTIRRLKERLRGGEDPPEIQMMLRICISTSVSAGLGASTPLYFCCEVSEVK